MTVQLTSDEVREAVKEWLAKRNLKSSEIRFSWSNTNKLDTQIAVEPITIQDGPYR